MPKDLSVIFVAHPATQIRAARSEFTEEYDVHVVSFTLPVALQGDEFPVMQSHLPGSLASLLTPRSQISWGSEYREPRPVARILATSLAVSWLRPSGSLRSVCRSRSSLLVLACGWPRSFSFFSTRPCLLLV